MVNLLNDLKSIGSEYILPNIINGELIESKNTLDKINPLNGDLQYKVSNSSSEEFNNTVKIANEAKKEWSSINLSLIHI